MDTINILSSFSAGGLALSRVESAIDGMSVQSLLTTSFFIPFATKGFASLKSLGKISARARSRRLRSRSTAARR